MEIEKWCEARCVKAEWHKTKGVKHGLGVMELYATADVN
jgi:hypothetical protein